MKKINQEEQTRIESLLQYADDQMPPPTLVDRIMLQVDQRPSPSLVVRCVHWFRQPSVFGLQPVAVAVSAALIAIAFWGGLNLTQSTVPQVAMMKPQADQSADSLFYIGRGLIAGGKYQQALTYLNRASKIDPARADFAYWQGVAYGMIGEVEKERSSYRRSLSFQPDFYQANLNLGHSYLEKRELDEALKQYKVVLTKNEGNLQALYNQALVYREMGAAQQEKASYYQYLQWSRTGKWARRAAFHLNRLGDFRYRVFKIGVTDMVIDTTSLLRPMGESTELEIDRILSYVTNSDTALHIIVFNKDKLKEAKETALFLRQKFLAQKNVQQDFDVKISWFDVADTLDGNVETQPVALKSSILIFTQSVLGETAERKMI